MVSIAIDGPGGAGKSSIAKTVAALTGYLYVDTGAIYRAVGLAAKRAGLEMDDEGAVGALLLSLEIDMVYKDGVQRMLLGGEDVSDAIRAHEISAWASRLSAMKCVRDFLLERQRALARENNVIMDGRDIGTVVLPDAQVKIFLTASPETRAKRRQLQLEAAGESVDFEKLLADIKARDEQDSNRPIAPLRQADDAFLADTTQLDFEESVELVKAIIIEKLKAQDVSFGGETDGGTA